MEGVKSTTNTNLIPSVEGTQQGKKGKMDQGGVLIVQQKIWEMRCMCEVA